MKYVLLFIIRLYWKFVPSHKRRKCLFRKSCSKYVYEELNSKGVRHGIRAFRFRMVNCVPEFDVSKDLVSGKKELFLKSGLIIKEEQIAPHLI